jgi:hypothetical protein
VGVHGFFGSGGLGRLVARSLNRSNNAW